MVEITLRTIQGRLLLNPTPTTTRTIAGAIGRAQRRHDMEIHAVVAMSNHIHLLISPKDLEQQARFMNYVGSSIARKVGKIVGWQDRFWGRRYRAIVVSSEDAAQIGRLRYLLAHGAKEGLVATPLDWPGLHSGVAIVDGTMQVPGIWRDETAAFRDRTANRTKPTASYEKLETIQLSPLPCWRGLTARQYRVAVTELVASIEAETLAGHRAAKTAPTGLSLVLSADPHERPRTAKRSPAPAFHAVTKAARKLLRDGYATFLACYREASEALRRGDWTVSFPGGCFPPGLPFVPDY